MLLALRLEAVAADGPDELAVLEQRREKLLRELGRTGDFRRGSLNAVMRRCGKPNCACADPGHPGHGPQYNLTRSVDGRTRTEHLRPGPELDKARREVSECQRFRDLVAQVTEVNEAICRARPAVPEVTGDAARGCRAGTGTRVERAAGASGAAHAAQARGQAMLIAGRKVVPMPPRPVPDMLYGVIDGTGVPMDGVFY
jgi:hypothetical protein